MSTSSARYPDLAGRTVFVSGGGSGIGAAFVRAFAAQGAAWRSSTSHDAAVAGARRRARRRRVAIWRCDVRDIAALQCDDRRSRPRARPGARARQQRRARRPARVRGRHARVLGRQPGRQPAPSLLRRAGGGAADDGGGRRRDHQPRARCRGCADARDLPLTRPRRRRSPASRARSRASSASRTSASIRSCRARSTPSASVRCGSRRRTSSELLEQQCLKFRVSEDDVARTALFLASDEARAITGQSLVVDAGLAQTSVIV